MPEQTAARRTSIRSFAESLQQPHDFSKDNADFSDITRSTARGAGRGPNSEKIVFFFMAKPGALATPWR
jgi:hypothetical protein